MTIPETPEKLTLQEAIKSGKPFRGIGKRGGFFQWDDGVLNYYFWIGKRQGYYIQRAEFSVRDVLAKYDLCPVLKAQHVMEGK